MMTRAQQILEAYHHVFSGVSDPALAGVAFGGGLAATGIHYGNKAMLRRSLRAVGYVDHPDDPNLMVHVKTGRTYSMGWGHPHD